MNEFVEECRREWKRLGVPDPVANEMAADLAADLREAEAEGVSAEEVLGSGAFDPRSFASAWAAERGVIGQPLPSGHRFPRRSRMAAAVAAFVVVAIVGAVMVIVASPSGPVRMTLASPVGPPLRVVPPPLPTPGARVFAVHVNGSGVDTRTVGSVLLIVGLSGIVLLTLFWLRVGPGRWSRRPTYIDNRTTGPA